MTAVLLGLIAGTAAPVQAQEVSLRLSDARLGAALDSVRAVTGFDLIYAERLVRDRRASCTYAGPDPAEALRCVLRDTGLRAERLRRGQYVLVEETDTTSDAPVPRAPLTGYVRDATTGEALPGAHVYLTAVQAGTVTNRAGYFAVSSLPAGPYAVRVSYLGYQTIDTTLTAGGGPTSIRLTPTSIESEGVVVQAGPEDEASSSRLPGMMSVSLDRLDQLPSLGEPDLFKALQWTPGIRKSGVVSGGLSVRGADPDQNLYLLDGAPVYHPWHAFSLISTFQTGTLKATNLYRGSFPAEHGGRLSAVLDAQMKDGDRREPLAVAAVSALAGRFRIETPVTERTSFMLSARRSYIDKLIGRTHPVQDASGRRDTLRTGYYFYDTSAKVAHRFDDRHRVSVSYYDGRDDLDLRLPFDLSLDFSSWLQPADLFFEVRQNWENRVVSAQHQWLANEDLFITSTAYYTRYAAQESTFVQPTSTAALTSDYRVQLDDAGAKVDLEYYHSVAHQVRAGLQVTTQQFESTLRTDLRRTAGTLETDSTVSIVNAMQLVGYVQDVWSPTPAFSIQPGVRFSYFSGGPYMHVAPRLSARYTVHPRYLTLRGGAGIHVQYLHRLRDRYSLAYDLVSSRWIPSSNVVRPAVGLQTGLGAQSRVLPWLTMELSLYARGARDQLVPEDVFRTKDGIEGPGIEVGALLGQYVPAKERAFGMELTGIAERGPWNVRLGAAAGRTFVYAPDRSGERWRPADLDVPVSVRAAVSWNGGPWETSLASELRSGYPVTVPEARYQLGDPVDEAPISYLYRPELNNGRLPAYFRLDASLAYRFSLLSADWRARLNVFNLTNRGNVVDRTFQPTGTGVSIDDQRGLPILPLLEIEMTL